MLQYKNQNQKFAYTILLIIFAGLTGYAQNVKRMQPVWWFGASSAANFNSYRGTTQMLNKSLTVPTAFHKGDDVKPYLSLLTEYRSKGVLGGMLNLAYDNRGAKFDGVMAPCNCPATLSTNISYIAIEPSLRLTPFSSSFYVFAGPTININVAKSFLYTQAKQPDIKADWSDINNLVFSAQVGAGIDIPISPRTSVSQSTISPFVSFQTNLGQQPRKVESWSLYTVRAGIALKFGTDRRSASANSTGGLIKTQSTDGSMQRNIYSALPVFETHISDDVTNKIKNKFGAGVYDITKMKSKTGKDIYMVRTWANSNLVINYVDENANEVPQ